MSKLQLPSLITTIAVLLATTAAGQNPPAVPPGAMGMPGSGAVATVPQVELTDQSAKAAIDSYLAIKEKYGDKVPDPNSSAEGYAALQDVQSMVGKAGFADTEEWHKTLTSVAVAYGFAKDGKSSADVDKSLAKLKNNPQIPEKLKQQMIEMIAGVRPSENNLTVVKSLMSDSDYGPKLAALSD